MGLRRRREAGLVVVGLLVVLVAVTLGSAPEAFGGAVQTADYIWWEAEDAEAGHNFNGWLRANELDHQEELSGDKDEWLSHYMDPPESGISARWSVKVPEAGTYRLFARKIWYHGPFEWKFGHEKRWHSAARTGLLDHLQLSRDFSANWVGLGEVPFDTPGTKTFEVKLLDEVEKYVGSDNWPDRGQAKVAAFDCFVLTKGRFLPRGELRPDEDATRHKSKHWAFAPRADTFSKAAIDLSELNHKPTGDGPAEFPAVMSNGNEFACDFDHDDAPDSVARFSGGVR